MTGFSYIVRCLHCRRSYTSIVDLPGYCGRTKCKRAHRRHPSIVAARDDIRQLVEPYVDKRPRKPVERSRSKGTFYFPRPHDVKPPSDLPTIVDAREEIRRLVAKQVKS